MSRSDLRKRAQKKYSEKTDVRKKKGKKVNRRPNVGDVIVSSDFVFGNYDYGDSSKKGPVRITGEQKDKAAYDESRGSALFVIEKAYMGGGGEGQNDHYPDYWNMEARRLNADKTHNETGEVITLTETYLEEHALEIVGAMKMQFVWI